MKNRLSSTLLTAIILLLAVVFSVSRAVRVQGNSQDGSDFSKLSLEIESTKKEFIQLEPIPIILMLTNKTSEPISGHSAIDLSQNYVKIFVKRPGAEVKKLRELSLNRKLVVASDRPIEPGEHYQSNQLLTLNLDEEFPQPGLYQLQAVLMDADGKREAKSNLLTIRIAEPRGLDYQAFEYIKKKGNPADFFYGVDMPGSKNTQSVIEEFESSFAESAYGDYASFLLGEFYFINEDYAKAHEKFEKMANKSAFIFAGKIKEYLAKSKEKLEKLGKLN